MAFLLSLKMGVPKIKFSLGDTNTIGRSSECEIQVLDATLSRRHALVYLRKSGFRLEDLKSRNGTFLNKSPVRAPVRLKNGDEIQVGDQFFIFNPSVDVLHEAAGDKSIYLVKEDPVLDFHSNYETLGDRPEEIDRRSLMDIYGLTCEVMSELDLDSLLNKLMDRLMAYFSADRGFVLSYRKSGYRFSPLVVRTEKNAIAISHTLLEKVLREKRPLLVHDALENLTFESGKSVVEHKLRSVMLVPLMAKRDIIGFIQIDKGHRGAFDQESLSKLSMFSRAAALALQNANRFEREKRKNLSFPGEEKGKTIFVSRDPEVLDLLAEARKVASSNARVLVTGESGTGKELIARMIHEQSPRFGQPFVAINCAAVPENLLENELFGHEKGAFTGATKLKKGSFELADEGTLFLDEVGDIAPTVQVKLLRAIQENTFFRVGGEKPVEVDIRIVPATNQDLKRKIVEGLFREDLYYRLNVITMAIPPLRERNEDIELLTRFFLERFSRQLGKTSPRITDGVLRLLNEYSWPGNVRELQNVVERIMVLIDGGTVNDMDLPLEIRSPDSRLTSSEGSLHEVLAKTEKEMLPPGAQKGKVEKGCRSSNTGDFEAHFRQKNKPVPHIGFGLNHEHPLPLIAIHQYPHREMNLL